MRRERYAVWLGRVLQQLHVLVRLRVRVRVRARDEGEGWG